jgi:hypothetical protein
VGFRKRQAPAETRAGCAATTSQSPPSVACRRQTFYQVIEAQPETPAVMIKSKWKEYGEDEKNREDELIMGAENGHAQQVNRNNHDFRRHQVNQNRANKESVLTFEQRVTRRTLMFYVERLQDDR